MRRSIGSLARKPAVKNHLENLGANGRRIFKCILRNWIGGRSLYSYGPGYEQIVGCCVGGNELLLS